jgi:uncharacterized protein YjbJ (UPF0337 family)/CheY-like chemotaxis protein
MTRVYLADAKPEERSALRLLLLDLKMEIVGEAADWFTTLANAPSTHMEMLLLDWGLLPINLGAQALVALRVGCPNAIVVILISHMNAHEQAALSTGADIFISKDETSERVAERLRFAAASVHVMSLDSTREIKPGVLMLSLAPVQIWTDFLNDLEDQNMNKDILEGQWKQIRGEAKSWWGKLTDDDLDRAAGKLEVLTGMLQEKYGYTREIAAKEIDKRVTEFEARMKKKTAPIAVR